MDRNTEIRIASKAILDEMINDLILSTSMAAHREIKRGRVVCGTCGTKCRAHIPLPPPAIPSSSSSSSLIPNSSAPPSRYPSPQPGIGPDGQPISRTGGYTVGPEKGTGGSTGIGSGSGRMDGNGNTFFECLVCGRSVASNRYAPHLSSCLGLNGSTRRGAARSAAVKARLGNNNDRSSPSPYVNKGDTGSDNGDWERGSEGGDSVGGKKKKKILNGASPSLTPSSSANAKRNKSPIKGASIPKKSKIGGTGSTPNSGSATPTPSFRQALPPSKLGRPPTNRPIDISQSPVSSPEKSIISITSSGQGGGMTGKKTLPGQNQGFNMGGAGPGESVTDVLQSTGGDESSEEEVDDY